GCASDLLATGTQLGDDGVDAVLVDGAQGGVGHAQADPAVLGFAPELAVLQVGQEAALGLVVGVGNVVTHHRCFTGHLADASHWMLQVLNSENAQSYRNFEGSRKACRSIPQPVRRMFRST